MSYCSGKRFIRATVAEPLALVMLQILLLHGSGFAPGAKVDPANCGLADTFETREGTPARTHPAFVEIFTVPASNIPHFRGRSGFSKVAFATTAPAATGIEMLRVIRACHSYRCKFMPPHALRRGAASRASSEPQLNSN